MKIHSFISNLPDFIYFIAFIRQIGALYVSEISEHYMAISKGLSPVMLLLEGLYLMPGNSECDHGSFSLLLFYF